MQGHEATAVAKTGPSSDGAKSKFRVLLTTSLVSSLIMLDSNIVAVALPAIGRSLKSTFTELEWVVTAYLLSYAALLLAAGAYADLKGRKTTMIVGLLIFGASSAACGGGALNVTRAEFILRPLQ